MIQKLGDQHKESMPTGVVTGVMDEFQKAYKTQPKLYKLKWTTVDSHAYVEPVEYEEGIAHVKLSHQTQTLIVEAVDECAEYRGAFSNGHSRKISMSNLPNHRMVNKSWLQLRCPESSTATTTGCVLRAPWSPSTPSCRTSHSSAREDMRAMVPVRSPSPRY